MLTHEEVGEACHSAYKVEGASDLHSTLVLRNRAAASSYLDPSHTWDNTSLGACIRVADTSCYHYTELREGSGGDSCGGVHGDDVHDDRDYAVK